MSNYKRQNIIMIEKPKDYKKQPVKDIHKIGKFHSNKLAEQGINNIGQLEIALENGKIKNRKKLKILANQDFYQKLFNNYMVEREETEKWKFIENIKQYVYVSEEHDYKRDTLTFQP